MSKIDTEEDIAAQQALLSRANKSMSILEKAFIFNGSGRYLNLRTRDLSAALTRHDADYAQPDIHYED